MSNSSATPWTVACQAPQSMGFPGKNTGVGCHFLLQGIFLTQGSNLGLPHCRQILYCLHHQESSNKLWYINTKGTTEDEMVGWHHQLDGHAFEQAPGIGDGQGSPACCSPWGCQESDTTERLNWTQLNSSQQWEETKFHPPLWMDLTHIMLHKRQTQLTHCMIPFTWSLTTD